MPKREAALLLADILEAIEKVESYTAGMACGEFIADSKTADAVVRNFEIIGEAAAQLAPDFTASHPEVPWRDLTDFRNILIHEYFGVDLQTVWQIIEMDLGVLKNLLLFLSNR